MNVHLWAPEFTGFGGGIGVFSRELARSISGLGHRLRLVGKLDRRGTWNGSRLDGPADFPRSLRNPAFAALAVRAAVDDHPDRIITTHVNFGPIARVAKKLSSARTSIIVHGIDVHPSLSSSRRNALRMADTVVAVSRWTRDRIADVCSIPANRVFILPNTVDEQRFTVRPLRDDLRTRLAIQSDERVVVTVARLDPSEVHDIKRMQDFPSIEEGSGHKGCDRLIAALPEVLRRCGPVKYVIVGKGADRSRLQELARRYGVADKVIFPGYVTDDDLPDYYRMADVFAMPSVAEGFGIVFLEAMACGTPVLAGNLDGSVDAVEDGELGLLVNPESVDEIADGISALLEQRGPLFWFNRNALHDAVANRFGHDAFRARVAQLLAT